MHTRASFDAAKDERTNINAEAVVTCDRASKYTRASSRTYLESSPTRSSRATRRLPEGITVIPVHPTAILEERMVKKSIPSNQTNQEAQLTMPKQLTFDGAARSSMAGNGHLQAHKIESM